MSFVYVLPHVNGKSLKIGVAQNIPTRMRSIGIEAFDIARSTSIKTVSVERSREVERALHKIFAASRIDKQQAIADYGIPEDGSTEWFDASIINDVLNLGAMLPGVVGLTPVDTSPFESAMLVKKEKISKAIQRIKRDEQAEQETRQVEAETFERVVSIIDAASYSPSKRRLYLQIDHALTDDESDVIGQWIESTTTYANNAHVRMIPMNTMLIDKAMQKTYIELHLCFDPHTPETDTHRSVIERNANLMRLIRVADPVAELGSVTLTVH